MTNTNLENALKIMIGSQEAEAMYIGSSLLWSNTPAVPYDCKIEYLEGTGTQWIDTLIHPETGYGFELYGGFTTFNNNEFFGGGTNWNNGLGICTHSQNLYGVIVGSTEVCAITVENNVMHLFKVNSDGTVYVDNEYKGQSDTSMPSGDYTMNIFRHSRTQVPQAAKIYYCKIFNSQGLVFDGIPVRKNNIGYMYDKVSGLLFGNSGTGDFVLGPDLNMIGLEYLESTGTQYIDLLFKPTTNKVTIQTNISITDTSQDSTIIGIVNDETTLLRFYPLGFSNSKFYSCNFSGIWKSSYSLNSSSVSSNIFYDVESTIGNTITLIVNNNTYTLSRTEGYNGEKSLYLFARNEATIGHFAKCKMKYLKIYESDILIMDLIPVRIGLVGYMYDKISGQLFGNNGSGTFTLGPDKT